MDVAEVLERTSRGSQGLRTAQQLAKDGVASWALSRAARRQAVLRVRRNVYATRPLPDWPRFVVTDDGPAEAHVRHVRAVLLSLGPSAAAAGRTAAALRGWGLLVEPARTVEVVLPHSHGHTAAPRVRVLRRRSVAYELLQVHGSEPLRVTTALQTAVDLALSLPLLEAVVAVDSALRAGDVTVEELRRQVGHLQGRREARRLERVLELCDPLSGSVLETVLRVHLVLAGLGGFVTQLALGHPDGRHVLRADLAFVAARLVVETDGARWHPDRGRDRTTDNQLAALGWRVLRFTWAEVVHDPARVVALVRAALAAPCTHLPRAA